MSQQEKGKIGQRFGVDKKRIKQCFLPWVNCFECRKTDFRSGLLISMKNLLWKTNQKKFYRFLSHGGFDFIYLNSIVLCEMISEQYPFFIHIREFLIDNFDKVFNQVRKATGVIFIDDSVVKPFMTVDLKNRIVLSNPVDMRPCEKYLQRGHPFDGWVVITMIGRIEEDKGVDFVIKAFKQTNSEFLRLIIVGDQGDGFHSGYMRYCRELAVGDKRILFWGEEKNISKIYAWSDYVIRGEIDFRMGRSVLEALYSGSNVIIPCSEVRIVVTNCELNKFKEKVYPYFPRDVESLKRLFSGLSADKIVKSNFASNVDEYGAGLHRYLWNALRPAPM